MATGVARMTRDERRVTELELAVLVALGHTGNVKVAAGQLGISERTAYRRLERLCRRLNVDTPIQAAFLVLKTKRTISATSEINSVR
jgi:DNA-binding NarL/FixJ family response regulator